MRPIYLGAVPGYDPGGRSSEPETPIVRRAAVTFNPHTAMHEAGHAVIGLMLGFDIDSAVVKADGSGQAKVRGYHAKPMAAIAIGMAGSLAERGDLSGMSEPDREIIDSCVRRCSGNVRDILATGERIARYELGKHAALVDLIAGELMRTGQLFGYEVRALAEGHTGRSLGRPPDPATAAQAAEAKRRAAVEREIAADREREMRAAWAATNARCDALGI